MDQTITLTKEQSSAVNGIIRRLQAGERETSMGGYAGTGKTTIIKYLIDALFNQFTMDCDVLAPTGKATRVLGEKGVEANTVHSYVYDYRGESKWVDARGEKRKTLHFDAKDERYGNGDLVIIDESSMINQAMAEDLRRAVFDEGSQILWVGDHGQLEPVGQNPGIMSNPDIRLETIMRQAEGNPIIDFAHRVRLEGATPGRFLSLADGQRLRICGRVSTERICEYADENEIDQIIVPFHKMRTAINRRSRQVRGFRERIEVGDKLVVKTNNKRQGIYNGMMFMVEDCEPGGQTGDGRDWKVGMRNLSDGRKWGDLRIWLPDEDGEYGANCRSSNNIAVDYGYAVTCHVAQGSEWDRVAVIYAPCRNWSNQRWLYTAATRAAKHLTVAVG